MTARGAALFLTLPFLPGLLPLVPAATAAAPAPQGRALVPRGRWHHEVPGPPRVRWSVLFRRSDVEDETRLLVETPSGRWTLRSIQPAAGTATREEVTDVTLPQPGETVSRTLTPFPPSATPECEGIRPPDACLVLEGSRGRFAAPLSAFSGKDAASLRRRVAAVVSPGFLARLKGLAPALPISDLEFYSEDFLALFEPVLARPPGPAFAGGRLPGCTFDATFGFPCTPEERRREEWLVRHAPTPPPR
ncbi:MAG: hypothetical protein IPP07_18200 [Holophagales bacterium]|nr:hypothetical protein [Holophagales bacterium]